MLNGMLNRGIRPTFSLVMATLGRTDEIRVFLQHLRAQTRRDFELIVVDQNPDERLAPLLEGFAAEFAISRLRSGPGLSRSRNLGISVAEGSVIGFPDDDCWYPPTLLADIATALDQHPDCGGISSSRDCATSPYKSRGTRRIDRRSVWSEGTSYTLFFRRLVIRSVGGFDESLGLGAGTRWGSGEETDLILRILAAGWPVYLEPRIKVGHPDIREPGGRHSGARARHYSGGSGRLLRQHRYPWWYFATGVAQTAAGSLLAVICGRVRLANIRWNNVLGRIEGWRAWGREQRNA